MSKYLIALGLILNACASAMPLNSGEYNVSLFYLIDTWPSSRMGEFHDAVYRIEQHGDYKYAIEVVNSRTHLSGHVQGDEIIFNRTMELGNCGSSDFMIKLTPIDEGSFTGKGFSNVKLCGMDKELVTEVIIESK